MPPADPTIEQLRAVCAVCGREYGDHGIGRNESKCPGTSGFRDTTFRPVVARKFTEERPSPPKCVCGADLSFVPVSPFCAACSEGRLVVAEDDPEGKFTKGDPITPDQATGINAPTEEPPTYVYGYQHCPNCQSRATVTDNSTWIPEPGRDGVERGTDRCRCGATVAVWLRSADTPRHQALKGDDTDA